jgi:hypothetical protein
MAALARTSSNYKRQAHPLVRVDYNRKCSVEKKKLLVVNLKGFVAKMDCLAVNRQS